MTERTQAKTPSSVLQLDWKVFLVAALILSSIGGAYWYLLPPPPRIVIEEDTYNWGTLPPGKAEHIFEVKNAGGKDLMFGELKTSCGCAKASASGPIVPGKMGTVSVIVDSSARLGEMKLEATIHSNDPDSPARTLHISGIIEPLVRIEPEQPMLEAPVGETARAELKLFPEPRLGTQIRSVKSRSGEVECTLDPEVKDGAARLTLAAKIEAPGVSKEYIDLSLMSDRGELEQSFVAVLKEPRRYFLSPSQLIFTAPTDAAKPHEMRLEFPAESQATVTEASLDDPNGSFALDWKKDPKSARETVFSVTLAHAPETASYRAMLLIKTTDESVPLIEAPIFYWRQAPAKQPAAPK